MVSCNCNGSQNLLKGLEEIRDQVINIVQFYDTNSYDLKIVSEDYTVCLKSWDNFSAALVTNSGKPITRDIQTQLARALQRTKMQTNLAGTIFLLLSCN